MKRWIVLALTLTLCAGVMAGCRNTNEDETVPSSTAYSTPHNTPMATTRATTPATQPMTTPMVTIPDTSGTDNGILPSESGNAVEPDTNRNIHRSR